MYIERVNESKRSTEGYKSNHTRKKNNSNLQSSLLQVSAICVFFYFYQLSIFSFIYLFIEFYQFFHDNKLINQLYTY